MSTIMDVYLYGPVHLANPGLEELLADTLSQGVSRSLLGPRGPADFVGISSFPGKLQVAPGTSMYIPYSL